MFSLIHFAISGSCRKFCDKRTVNFGRQWGKFFSKHIIDMLTNSFHLSIEKERYLVSVHPNGPASRTF